MRLPCLAMLVWLASACTSPPPPEPARYLLRAPETERLERARPARVGLGRLEVAPYLDQPGVVVETEAHTVRAARHHLWAEPLEEGLRRLLRAEVSRALEVDVEGDPDRRSLWDCAVDVRIDQLHGTLDGKARLVARWRLDHRSEDEPAQVFRLVRTAPLASGGYPGLVAAEIDLVRQLAGAIARSVADASAP